MNEVALNLKKFIEGTLPKAINNGLEVCGQYMENQCKENIVSYNAVDTAFMKNSVTHVVNEEEYEVTTGTPAEYAPAVHQGHGNLPGRPFLQDVADYNMNEIVQSFKRGTEL